MQGMENAGEIIVFIALALLCLFVMRKGGGG